MWNEENMKGMPKSAFPFKVVYDRMFMITGCAERIKNYEITH